MLAHARSKPVLARNHNQTTTEKENSPMRDFEDVDGDCNESQPRWDDEYDDWDLDNFESEDGESKTEDSADSEKPEESTLLNREGPSV
jgi:hypothetical protein